MNLLGVRTSDFSVYYDLVRALRDRGIPFVTLEAEEPVPPHVGVLLTTPRDLARDEASAPAPVDVVLATGDVDRTIDDALRHLEGSATLRRCIIGIDPGERPGIAVIADGRVRRLAHAKTPEAVRPLLDEILSSWVAQRVIVRLGNGAPTFRDRILHGLVGLDVELELVDEAHSTPIGMHNAERDTQAATSIALTPGRLFHASDVGPVVPTEGELRDIQRKSRMASEGAVTISRDLARGVALGRLTLDEAVARQQGRA